MATQYTEEWVSECTLEDFTTHLKDGDTLANSRFGDDDEPLLHVALRTSMTQEKAIEVLKMHPMCATLKDNCGKNGLHIAAQRGKKRVFDMIIKAGHVEVNDVCKRGTVVDCAIVSNQPLGFIKWLMEGGQAARRLAPVLQAWDEEPGNKRRTH